MTSSDAKEDIYTRQPELARPGLKLSEQYARFKLCASIDWDGEHCFFVLTASKGLPLPLRNRAGGVTESRGALTETLQSMARVDILSRVEQLAR